MRIRLPFLAAFFTLLLLAGYAGLSSLQLPHINDKLLHFITFFLLTLVFYWILDTTRRRNFHLTLFVCTGALGIGSEFLQGFLPNGRIFDIFDIIANIAGSLSALGGCYWYHNRMLERKRARRGYGAVGQVDDEDDVELGEGGLGRQESGVTGGPFGDAEDGLVPDHVAPPLTPTGNERGKSLEEEVDGWDENEVEDWDDEDAVGTSASASGGGKTPSASSAGEDAGDIGTVEIVPKKKLAID